MLTALLSFLLLAEMPAESLPELGARRTNQQQSSNLDSLLQEKRRLQQEIQYKKEEIQTIRLRIVDRQASGQDLLSTQMDLQYLVYALQTVEEEIQCLRDRGVRMYGDILTQVD